jgi:hypothetical protein
MSRLWYLCLTNFRNILLQLCHQFYIKCLSVCIMYTCMCVLTWINILSIQSCIRIFFQKIIINYCSGTIYIILDKTMCQCNHFRAFSIHRGSACIVQRSAWALPGSTGAMPGSIGAPPASFEKYRGNTGMNRSFTRALPGWSDAHPGWLVGNYRSAAGVSVTATIISPRIVPDHPSNLPGKCWAMPEVTETAA